MRKFSLFLVAFIVAAGAFWVTMLTTPPTTEAAQPSAGINISDLTIQKGLLTAESIEPF
jgi:hypothetical protein